MIRLPQEHAVTNPPGQIINRPMRCKMNQTCTCQNGKCDDAPSIEHDRPLAHEIERYFKEKQ
jgi:hypothetical protein